MPDDRDGSGRLTNDELDLLYSNGYIPGELPVEDERELLQDLTSQAGDNEGIEPLSDVVTPDENDGND